MPELSSFILPSVMHREPLQIAISTGGMAPEAAKAVRREIETTIGDDWSRWIALLVAVRAAAAEEVDDPDLGRRAIEIAAREETRLRVLSAEDVTAASVIAQARAERDDEAATAEEADAPRLTPVSPTPLSRRRGSRVKLPPVATDRGLAVITGGSSGIGLATATALAKRGMRVALGVPQHREAQARRGRDPGGRALGRGLGLQRRSL